MRLQCIIISSKTHWVNAVPIKVNVLAWRVSLDCLPTDWFNLSRRGLDLQSILCPNCGKAVESTSHIFYACPMARDLCHKIATWWDVSFSDVSSYEEWLVWFTNLQIPSNHKEVLEAVFYILWWFVWSFQNKSLFGSSIPSKAVLFEDIVALSFYWCT